VLFAGTAVGILVALGVLAKRNLKSPDGDADEETGNEGKAGDGK
jgi:hypothetical protein